MTTKQLAANIASELDLSKVQAKNTIEVICREIVKGVKKDGTVGLFGFGTFKQSLQKGRSGNMNGKAWSTQDKMILKFKPQKNVF